uniref:Uncharacterized protein n=1 Tax=Anguilla anguilla TaxID=7936 RepID=A0A0E9XXC8_ANGAN
MYWLTKLKIFIKIFFTLFFSHTAEVSLVKSSPCSKKIAQPLPLCETFF